MLVQSCASTPEIRYVEVVTCSPFSFIYPTNNDIDVISRKLVDQINAHNRTLERCNANQASR